MLIFIIDFETYWLSYILHQGENRHNDIEVYAGGFNTLCEKYCVEICWYYGVCCLSNHALGFDMAIDGCCKELHVSKWILIL